MGHIAFQVTLLLAGIGLLWWAGDRAVRYAARLSELLGISSFVVGFVVLSVATGLPEITTAAVSVVRDVAGLSAGDLIGSSLVNMTLVLGAATIAAGYLAVDRHEEETVIRMLAVITLLVSGIVAVGHLTAIHGVVLLGAYAGAIAILHRRGMLEKIVKEDQREATEEYEPAVMAGMRGTTVKLLGALAFVVVGARLTVDAAVAISAGMGLPIETIGATVVAVGTGLPELSLELNAVRERQYGLALGDIFGSTLVNLTLVLGILSIASPAPVAIIPLLGTLLYIGATLVLLWYALVRNHGLDRTHGYLLVLLFVLYLVEEFGVAEILYHVV